MVMTARPAEYFVRRFWSLVDKQDDGCWTYQGLLKSNGYGHFYPGGGRGTPKVYVHRYAYELCVGPIPEGLDLDHLCRVRNCVNPAHLEPVTRQENLLRGDTVAARNAAKTHCPQGHEYSPENMYLTGVWRRCATCSRERSRKQRVA